MCHSKIAPIQKLSAILVLFVCYLYGANIAHARTADQAAFNRWLIKDMSDQAQSIGFSRREWINIASQLNLKLNLPDLNVGNAQQKKRQKQRQSEFASPKKYFKESSLQWLVKKGRGELRNWRKTLRKIENKYRVPKEVLVAIWGRESNFGRARIPHSALDILATQAFIGRRKEMFTREFIAALKIIKTQKLAPKSLKSSWAGAMGHPQFMPTVYLKYAVDFDGDGQKNIWSSPADALASIANFLSQKGWNYNRHWGTEINLPRQASCAHEGPDQAKSGAQWMRLGVKKPGQSRPMRLNPDLAYCIVSPAGRFGPSFLISENFYVLKEYNESDVYALFVGHLADRLRPRRNRAFKGNWKKIGSFSRYRVEQMQRRMIRSGYDVGGPDGLVGYKTRRSIGCFEQMAGLKQTCFPNNRLVKHKQFINFNKSCLKIELTCKPTL